MPCLLSRCDLGGRKGIIILGLTGRLLASGALLLNYLVEELVRVLEGVKYTSNPTEAGVPLVGHHLQAMWSGDWALCGSLRHHH